MASDPGQQQPINIFQPSEYMSKQGTGVKGSGTSSSSGSGSSTMGSLFGGGASGLASFGLGAVTNWLNKLLGGHKGNGYTPPTSNVPSFDTSSLDALNQQVASLQSAYDQAKANERSAKKMSDSLRWYNKGQQALANLKAAKNVLSQYQQQQQQQSTDYQGQMDLVKNNNDASGLTNTAMGGVSSTNPMKNMFGNLIRGGNPSASITGEGFKTTMPNNSFLSDYNINFKPMFDFNSTTPNFSPSNYSDPGQSFGQGFGQQGSEASTNSRGMGGVSTPATQVGTAQGGINLAGKDVGGSFGNKQMAGAMDQMFNISDPFGAASNMMF